MSVSILFGSAAMAQSPKFVEIARTPKAAMAHAKSQMPYWGWQKSEWGCLKQLWQNESNWRANALNKTPVRVLKGGKWVRVQAGGIPQILGLKPTTSVSKQIHAGFVYIQSRYGSPCVALRWWKAHYWY